MATLTFNLALDTAVSPDWCGMMDDDGGIITPASSQFGYQVSSSQSRWYRGRIGATGNTNLAGGSSQLGNSAQPNPGSGNTSSTAADYFRSRNRYTGTFAAGNWNFTYVFRAGSQPPASTNASMNGKLWVGPNSSGSGARGIGPFIFSSSPLLTINTANTDYTATATANLPAPVTLNNEYIFLTQEWNCTGTVGGNVVYRRPGSLFTTTDFVSGSPAADTRAIIMA